MDDFGLWDVFLSVFWFMLLFAWIVLVFRVIAEVFRDDELGGGGKAFWTIFVILVPWLGVLVYLIARGGAANERAMRDAQAAAGTGGGSPVSSELKELAALRYSGGLSQADYEAAKAKVLS
jgi:hypothetical protein